MWERVVRPAKTFVIGHAWAVSVWNPAKSSILYMECPTSIKDVSNVSWKKETQLQKYEKRLKVNIAGHQETPQTAKGYQDTGGKGFSAQFFLQDLFRAWNHVPGQRVSRTSSFRAKFKWQGRMWWRRPIIIRIVLKRYFTTYIITYSVLRVLKDFI